MFWCFAKELEDGDFHGSTNPTAANTAMGLSIISFARWILWLIRLAGQEFADFLVFRAVGQEIDVQLTKKKVMSIGKTIEA
ncbi:MAG: hypothetical protein IJJ33_20120 [Victivallales bacterium]|nr:hypothetical protein [Victivallales bacterium]